MREYSPVHMLACMKLSLVMPYYRNPLMLARQYRVWREEWPAWHKDLVDVVIVDDGSPEPAADVERSGHLPFIRIFRVLEDRPWHQHGARNLGAREALADYLLMTDIDHVVPPETIRWCVDFPRPSTPKDVVTFGRVDAPAGDWLADDADKMERTIARDGRIKPHVNSFLLTKELYWSVGGYDESYCGLYGTDNKFRRRLYAKGREVHYPASLLIRVGRDVIPDASTVAARKEARDPGAKKRVENAKSARGEANKIVTLDFPWERVV